MVDLYVCSSTEINREEFTVGMALCVCAIMQHWGTNGHCTHSRGDFVNVKNRENYLSYSVFDEHGHRKNALVEAREDDVAMIEIPDDESLGNSSNCGDS